MNLKSLMILTSLALCNADDLFSDRFVKSINRQNTTWKAQTNFVPEIDMDSVSHLTGEKTEYWIKLPPKRQKARPVGFEAVIYPKYFNAFDKWPYCTSILDVKDQGACGSCWAIATSSVITDRICIKSKGKISISYSAQDLLACCSDCGNRCSGGSSAAALNHWVLSGLVTGGAYDSEEGCQPYGFEPCQHHVEGPRPSCRSLNSSNPKCIKKCVDTHNLTYEEDIVKGDRAYTIKNDTMSIMDEIITHGPPVCIFEVYQDFLAYKSGVYQHVKGSYIGRHAVKLIGWGEENGVPYWLLVNSWNSDWGDFGFFKFLRGSNHCGIEQYVIAALPTVTT